MGYGYDYKCGNCKKDYSVRLGIGMMFPRIYQSLINSIANGDYGLKWKELLSSHDFVAVNAETKLYVCKCCGHWKTDYVLDLYKPKNPHEIPEKEYGIKTVCEWGYVPYVMNWDLRKNYTILKRFFHKCERCGKRMHVATQKDLDMLSCPKCGYGNKIRDHLKWD